MNVNGTLNALKLLYNPYLCLPQLTIGNFKQLPIPIAPSIKAVVLDKDNCFAFPHEDSVWPEYKETWENLKKAYPGAALLIVSNTAGSSDDKDFINAKILEKNTGVPVLRHRVKKPGCKDEIFDYFRKKNLVESPAEIAVIGDRLFTDIMMANMMGAYGVWLKDGVKPSNSPLCKFERLLFDYLTPGN